MEWASQLGLVVFLLASGTTGGRLLWRGVRGGGLHERLLGVTYFLGGPLGYVPLILVVSGATPDAWTPARRAFGHLNLELSALALYAFNRLVFRPGSTTCGWAVRLLSVGLVASWLGLVFVDGLEGRLLGGSASYWIDFSLRAGAYVWAAAESLYHYVLSRRRLRLGLADPVVADRFLLWGIAMSAVSAMFVNAGVSQLMSMGVPTPLWYLLDGGFAVIASGAMWVTFFPPQTYLAWVARRTSALRA